MSYWRNSFKYPRFFFLDARVAVFFLLFLLHIRIWTLIIMILVFAVFYMMERYGINFSSALRGARSYLTGKIRPPLSEDKSRKPIDYDRRPLF